MKKITSILVLMLFAVLMPNQMEAQKAVLYLNNANSNDEGGAISAPGNDAIVRMLNADANFVVTAGTIDGSGNISPADLTPYDLVIIQEDVSSGNNAFKSSVNGPLAPKNLTVPVIYSKSEAFRNDKATFATAAGIASDKSSISVTVPAANQGNPLFSGIDFSAGDDVRLFYTATNGNGTDPGNTALKVLNGLEMDPVSPTLATTPEVSDVNSSVVINHIPTGTKLGTDAGDATTQDIVIFAFAYGAQVRDDGKNITSEALTIWRNAAYTLTGLTVPSTPYENPDELSLVLYLNASGSSDEGGQVSAPGDDAITRMLDGDPNFMVEAGIIDGSGVITPSDLSPYDLIIIQEDNTSGNAAFKSSANGDLAPKNIPVPVIYCKSEAFRNDKATLSTAASIASNKSSISVTVPTANQSNPIFNGIDFSNGDDIRLFYTATNGNGTDPGNTAIKVLNDLEMDPVSPTLATTPEVTDVNKSVVINHIPEGTKLGLDAGDVTAKDIVVLAFAHGAQRSADGKNITSEALTIWRNAAYILTGKTVPTELYENTEAYKQILYVNQTGVGQGAGASAPGDDPVINMFKNDGNFFVTYVETPSDGSAIPDISGFDLVIAQETISSGADLFKPGGKLGVKDLTTPIIYNKTWAFRDGRAVTDADAAVTATQNVSITATNTVHPLFRGIDFTNGNDIRIFKTATANDDGSTGGNKAIDVLNNLEIGSAGAASIATVPEVADANKAFVVNYLPAGTQLGEAATDVLGANAVALSFSYGATILGDGANITPEALTIWRNAAYMLIYGATEVPTTLVDNPAYMAPAKLLYVNKAGLTPGEGASAFSDDPIIRMFNADANVEVTYVESDGDGTGIPDISNFDVVIAQETFGSGDNVWKPGGTFGVKDITTPVIYNKTWAFRDGRAVTDSDAAVTATQNLSITAANTSHPLFRGIDLTSSSDIRIFKEATANDDGSVGGNKAIDVLNDLEIGSAAGASLATVPEVTDAAKAIVVNYLPAGTQLGEAATDVLGANAVALSFSYGATILGDGSNISPEALTIWRNAVYMLAFGPTEVPTTLVENPDFTLSIDKVGEVSNVSSNVRAIGNRIYVSDVKLSTEVNIYSLSGALVKTIKTNNDTSFEFNTGLWIATIKTSEGTKAVKLLVQ